tara:strand:+ start:201 stop:1475 length:1275 start_codon:yes stop_codon:yes gene_type:complete
MAIKYWQKSNPKVKTSEIYNLILPLEGLSVVEGSAFVAAPSGGMTLAQLGADVIRFDQIGGGIDYKRWPLSDEGVSLYWNGLNRGKRSIVADLRNSEVQILLSDLIARSGNFLTNFPTKGWLSYEKISNQCSDLVMVSITGSHDGTAAVDYTINCAVGVPWITGHADDPRPVNHALPAWDLICGQTAALGMVAADRHRIRTGEGQVVSLALSDVALAAVAWRGDLTEVELGGGQREKLGNDLYGAFGRDFLTMDNRHVMVVAITQKQWESLLDATQSREAVRELASELKLDFTDEGSRFIARERLGDLFSPWFKRLTFAEVSAQLDKYNVCWGPYRTFRELLDEDPRCSLENPMFSNLDQPGVGTHLVPGSPLAFGGSMENNRNASLAPVLGEHTEQVLAEDLDLSPNEIGSLVDRGLIFIADN